MRINKICQVTTGILALILWFSSMQLFMHFDAVNPTQPDVQSGAIYPQQNHGHVVYLTASEKHQWYGLMILAGISFLICAVLSIHILLLKRQGD